MKAQKPREPLVMPREPRPKQFDTRLLDQLESYIHQYRYWHADTPPDGAPATFVIDQRETYRVGLREAAIRVAKALDGIA